MPATYIRQTPIVCDPSRVEAVRRRLQFGPEIECGLPFHPCGGEQFGWGPRDQRHISFPGCTEEMANLFVAGTDGSIRTNLSHAAEIKTRTALPIAKVPVLLDFVKALSERGVRVNPSCGFHVHVSLKDMNREFREGRNKEEKKILLRTMALAHKFSAVFHAVAGRRSRWTESYAPPIGDRTVPVVDLSAVGNLRPEDTDMLELPPSPVAASVYSMNELIRTFGNGRSGIHFSNYREANRGLYEVRAYSGTVKPVKVLGYVAMAGALLHMAAAATEDSGCTIAPPEDICRSTTIDFEARLEEFFTFFGWTDDGFKLGLPDLSNTEFTLEQVKTELRRLAHKTATHTPTGDEDSENENRNTRDSRTTPAVAVPTATPSATLASFYREVPASEVFNNIPSNPDEVTEEVFDSIFAEFDRMVASMPATT